MVPSLGQVTDQVDRLLLPRRKWKSSDLSRVPAGELSLLTWCPLRSGRWAFWLWFDDGCEPPGVEVVGDEIAIAIEEPEHDVERLAEVR